MDVTPAIASPAGQLAEPDLESLSGRVKRGDKAAVPALARQFESVFMAQLVKEMRQTLDPGTLFGNDPGDVFGGMFDLFLGKHLAQAGGIGLAAVLERYLGAGPQPGSATPTGSQWEPKSRNLPKPV